MSENRYETGLSIRRQVVGDEYVQKALDNADAFSGPLQELVTEYCWGAVWGRDNVDHKLRSLLNIGMLSALNRNHELKLHVRGALRNGCTPDEIREVLLQVVIYCGVPAGVEAFRVAREALDEAGVSIPAQDSPA